KLDISYFYPFFTTSVFRQSISIYINRSNFAKTYAVAAYQLDTIGARLMYGVPRSTFSNVSGGITFANNTVKQSDGYQASIVQWFIQ
ncbi:outer membrane protein assembly factor BamA, partial [Francisella tularensis subsp. holarctica]|nr:outer membrane protein assembly factor BamA [Francisella tularensis subsp. holarctica]